MDIFADENVDNDIGLLVIRVQTPGTDTEPPSPHGGAMELQVYPPASFSLGN